MQCNAEGRPEVVDRLALKVSHAGRSFMLIINFNLPLNPHEDITDRSAPNCARTHKFSTVNILIFSPSVRKWNHTFFSVFFFRSALNLWYFMFFDLNFSSAAPGAWYSFSFLFSSFHPIFIFVRVVYLRRRWVVESFHSAAFFCSVFRVKENLQFFSLYDVNEFSIEQKKITYFILLRNENGSEMKKIKLHRNFLASAILARCVSDIPTTALKFQGFSSERESSSSKNRKNFHFSFNFHSPCSCQEKSFSVCN